jgi:hypothetical protein
MQPQPKQRILAAPVYKPGKPIDDVKREYGLTDVIKLASNENPYGSSPKVAEVISAQLQNLAIYPRWCQSAVALGVGRFPGSKAGTVDLWQRLRRKSADDFTRLFGRGHKYRNGQADLFPISQQRDH